ncbi:MAG TPA: response regulator [Candidatus Limnocylindrales bacterium]|jgi:CheY-like chemotaxis protein|nr:response regulator [Candidatus Limnocylindrales bacterium]
MTGLDVRKQFGAAVRAHRLRLGLSQETLAERAELHRTYVTDVERGARNLSLESISRLARALDISIGSLFLSSTGGESNDQNSGSIHILLVEDDPKDIELALRAFAEAKLANQIEIARDGATALDYMLCRGRYAQRQPKTPPHVVLLDLYLPKVDGLEVLRSMRANDTTRRTHVVVLTNSRSDAHVREALRLGADAYIVKPIDFQSFSAITPQLNLYWSLLNHQRLGS